MSRTSRQPKLDAEIWFRNDWIMVLDRPGRRGAPRSAYRDGIPQNGVAQGSDAHSLPHIVHPDDISALRDGQRLRGEARFESLGRGQVALSLEERLARGADEDRPSQRGQNPQVAQDAQIVPAALPEADTGIDDDSILAHTGAHRQIDPAAQKGGDLRQQVAVAGSSLHGQSRYRLREAPPGQSG